MACLECQSEGEGGEGILEGTAEGSSFFFFGFGFGFGVGIVIATVPRMDRLVCTQPVVMTMQG